MVMMSQSPILQNSAMELEDSAIYKFSSDSEENCLLSSEADCEKVEDQGNAITDTISGMLSDGQRDLNTITNDLDTGEYYTAFESIGQFYSSNMPSGQVFDVETESTDLSSVYQPFGESTDWFCILFPYLCGDWLVVRNSDSSDFDINYAINTIRFDWTAGALDGSIDIEDMINEAEGWLADDGTEARSDCDNCDLIIAILIIVLRNLSSGSIDVSPTIGALLASSLAYSIIKADWSDLNEPSGIIPIFIPVIISLGIWFSTCESVPNCSPSPPNLDELRYRIPKDFLDENPSYANNVFSKDSTEAKLVISSATNNYRNMHGKILSAAVSYAASEHVELCPPFCNITVTDFSNAGIDILYTNPEPLSTESQGRIACGGWCIGGLIFLTGVAVGLWESSPAAPPGSGSGASEVVSELRSQSRSSQQMPTNYSEPTSFIAELLDTDTNVSGLIRLNEMRVNHILGESVGSEYTLFQFIVYSALKNDMMPQYDTPTQYTDCNGWSEAQECSSVVDEVNEIYYSVKVYSHILEILPDGMDLTPGYIDILQDTIYCMLHPLEHPRCLDFAGGVGMVGDGGLPFTDSDHDWAKDELSRMKEDYRLHEYSEDIETSGRTGDPWLVLPFVLFEGGKIVGQIIGGWIWGSSAPPGTGTTGAVGDLIAFHDARDWSAIPELTSDSNGAFNSVSAMLTESYSVGERDTDFSGELLAALTMISYNQGCLENTNGRVYGDGCTGVLFPWLISWLVRGNVPTTGMSENVSSNYANGECPIEDAEICESVNIARAKSQLEINNVLNPTVVSNVESDRSRWAFESISGGSGLYCLVDSSNSVSDDTSNGRSIDISWWIIWAILTYKYDGAYLLSANINQGGDATYLIDGLKNHDVNQPWNPPQDDIDALIEDMRLLTDLIILWGVADLVYPQAIESGMSPEMAHLFTVGVSIGMLVVRNGEIDVETSLDDSADSSTEARSISPMPGLWQFIWMLEYWIRVGSGSDGGIVPPTSSDCWDNDEKILHPPTPDWGDDWITNDIDKDGIPNSMETDPGCWNTPVNSKTTDNGCVMVEDLKDGTGDGTSDSTSDSSDEDEDDDGFLPGFGFMSTLISLLGVAILLQRKQREDND